MNKNYWKRFNEQKLRIIFSAIYLSQEENNIFDVKELFKINFKNIDLLTYSFPCQDLSQQGKQQGMSKNSGTRLGLLWEIEKALDCNHNLPHYIILTYFLNM